MNKMYYIYTCWHLLCADLSILKKNLVDKLIDVAIWTVLTLFVTGYIMPYFGLSGNFGPFQLGGVIAAVGCFELYGQVVELLTDFNGDRIISYYLTLPIPAWMVLMSKALYFACTNFILSLAMFPLGKICLWNRLDLINVSYVKLVAILFVQSFFYSFCSFWCTSVIADISKIGSVWSRFIFPLWFMGGFQFSWYALHSFVPLIAYVDLINPMIYITEGTRAALLGQEEYLSYGLCFLMIILFSVLFMVIALGKLKKRLDFI